MPGYGIHRSQIAAAVDQALAPAFRRTIERFSNPYYRKGAAKAIADRLQSAVLDESLTLKRFHDLNVQNPVLSAAPVEIVTGPHAVA